MDENQNAELEGKESSAADAQKPAETKGADIFLAPVKIEKEAPPSPQPQIPNSKPQTAQMEVHHHPQVEKKNFKEYFLEFLMIFLAVTMGFFAENIREHYAERKNAREYLESYRDELLQHRKLFDDYKKLYQQKVIVCDSIKNIFWTRQENTQIGTLARLMLLGVQNIEVPVSTPSYDQMINSGALRYIHNIALRDSMAAYRGQVETFKSYNTRILESVVNNTFEIAKLEDFHDIVSVDTSQSYNLLTHVPAMERFSDLSTEQRRSLVFFYEAYIVQAQSDLRRLRLLTRYNENLLKFLDDELK